MISATTFAGRQVAVFGLGRSGNATCAALAAGGARVAAWDDNSAARAETARLGYPVVDLAAADWTAFAALVLAPGVPLTHPEPHWTVARARAAGVEVIGDVEIFFRERMEASPTAPVIAVTGTNGKSTTTALIAHVLSSAGRDVQMGGNIGTAILSLAPPAAGRCHVIEMSSFQIDLTPSLRPTVGVLLNVTPDHLDRHGPADDPAQAMQSYAAIKARLIAQSTSFVVSHDDVWCRAAIAEARQAGGSGLEISIRERADVYYQDGALHLGGDASSPAVRLTGIGTLRGAHNGQNAAAALAAAMLIGVTPAEAARAMASYPGLPHRMEEVGRLAAQGGDVLFINDSKATNADSTEKALASFPAAIHWILGGKPKEGGITSLAAYFPRIARAYLIGEASEAFAATLQGQVPCERSGTLEAALAAARRNAAAAPGPGERIVLLSPACASYDQFKSFEHRGDEFRRLVGAIPGVVPPGRGR
jgi:UDP-N-acetylmuramoylalanine--D-glutamate ligase